MTDENITHRFDHLIIVVATQIFIMYHYGYLAFRVHRKRPIRSQRKQNYTHKCSKKYAVNIHKNIDVY